MFVERSEVCAAIKDLGEMSDTPRVVWARELSTVRSGPLQIHHISKSTLSETAETDGQDTVVVNVKSMKLPPNLF